MPATDRDEKVQLARNEAVFREVNEAIAAAAERFEADETEFVCECGDVSCADRITADLDAYEDVRQHPTRFILLEGHERHEVERVVERRPEYAVVEKVERSAAAVARRLDPRAASA
jgi:hypothetical protein